ncbi:DMT family transporter [Terrarubrum flagellatum]|uniref:DMT family transporter n=1 Tax=Terrirubrum flagellatum TaxID=2895980 RepID=UPI003145561C
MAIDILLALLNGAFIGASRAINGKLSVELGAFKASIWNHLVGFLVLTAILASFGTWPSQRLSTFPPSGWLGGVFGALFVAVTAFVFPRLGATKAALFVIGGQMSSAIALDWWSRGWPPGVLRCLGACLVLVGLYISLSTASFRLSRK